MSSELPKALGELWRYVFESRVRLSTVGLLGCSKSQFGPPSHTWQNDLSVHWECQPLLTRQGHLLSLPPSVNWPLNLAWLKAMWSRLGHSSPLLGGGSSMSTAISTLVFLVPPQHTGWQFKILEVGTSVPLTLSHGNSKLTCILTQIHLSLMTPFVS